MVKLIREFIVVFVTCKNEEMKALECSQHTLIFRHSRAGNSAVNRRIIKALMLVLVFGKNEADPIKNEGARVLTTFIHYKFMGIFPGSQGQLTPQSLVRSGRISNSSEIS